MMWSIQKAVSVSPSKGMGNTGWPAAQIAEFEAY